MPEIEGRKKGGVFKAILGGLLIGAALFFSGGALGAALPGFLGSMGLTFGSIALMGAGLVLSAFATPPKAEKDSEATEKQSAMYRGPLNTQGQGDCVPIVYGHGVEAGGVVFHTGVDIEEVPGRGEGEALDPPVVVEVGR
jgi:predicted phage tail protein